MNHLARRGADVVCLQELFAGEYPCQAEEHAKFAEEFRSTMKVLKRFVEVSNQHAPFLLRKAAKIEEYLHQR